MNAFQNLFIYCCIVFLGKTEKQIKTVLLIKNMYYFHFSNKLWHPYTNIRQQHIFLFLYNHWMQLHLQLPRDLPISWGQFIRGYSRPLWSWWPMGRWRFKMYQSSVYRSWYSTWCHSDIHNIWDRGRSYLSVF